MQEGSWVHVQHDDLVHEHPLDYVQRDVRDFVCWQQRMIDARREWEYREALHDLFDLDYHEYVDYFPHLYSADAAWEYMRENPEQEYCIDQRAYYGEPGAFTLGTLPATRVPWTVVRFD